ncbi:peptidoglycan/LPS O-acetylase OafA/YrhL [Erwinia persicina]|uniref:acyltransferase family protein n=1 Tax=Erwinia persicina TaxID=55211 RepID=UPI00209DDF5C|nr:acyltransferase [Erwinia persicina]MCP1440492.1 peptidoglycan/LPS O-acetylase OafA/YrhL [Erwinia persicina]
MNKNDNNQWLDICRALAILMVLLSHGRGYLIPIWEPFNGFKFGGFLGVELFFALSGFLIGKIIIRKSISDNGLSWISPFWFRRWARTYPIYLIFLLINILLLYWVRPAPNTDEYLYLTFTQALASPHPTFFGEAWSLAIEELFYFMTPLLYAVLFYFFKSTKKSLFFCLLIMMIAPTLYRIYLTNTSSLSLNEIRTISLARLDSIMYGVFFAWALYFFPSRKDAIISFSKKVAILFPILAYITHLPDDTINNICIMNVFLFNASGIVCASVIVCGLDLKIHRVLNKITNIVARCSYIAYLVNLPVLYFMHNYVPTQTTKFQGMIWWVVYLSSTLMISIFIHKSLEKRILMIRDRISPR